LNDIAGSSAGSDPQAEAPQILIPKEAFDPTGLKGVECAFRDFSGRHDGTSGTLKVITGQSPFRKPPDSPCSHGVFNYLKINVIVKSNYRSNP
jgi:hypothetical protein